MVQPGIDGLDTPRTNLGDATYLSRQPDFDITQEPSFQSPSKDANVFQQLRNGGRPNLRTPRGRRAPFTDRRNLPAGIGGAEFTPLLKSVTRNSARRHSGKENGLATPAVLDKIDEDLTPMPAMDASVFGASRNASSYLENTPLPQVESSSTASTPLVMRTRADTKGPLQDGQQLSLREQENVIDKIEKENFGLKLKIHFLEEALRKAGPGFSQAALKENTELKVDKVTMQRELQKYKKHLTSAERDLESYRQQILEVQEKAKRKYADESQRVEIERLQRELEDKEADIEDLQRQLQDGHHDQDKVEKLQDDIGDLEAELREKDRIITAHEDELDDLRSRVQDAEDSRKDAERRMVELEEKAQSSDELEEAKETIEDLEANIRQMEQQLDDMKDKLEHAVSQKDRAEGDLEELQEEMANKSVVTKGLSRQVEEKIARLQAEVEKAHQDYSTLEKQFDSKQQETDDLKAKLKESRQERDMSDKERRSLAVKLEEIEADYNSRSDEKALLQTRHDALTNESASLQRDVARLEKTVSQLEEELEQERHHALEIERDIRAQYKDEIDRLNDDISDLQAEVREKENLYDNDSEKWENEKHNLESERERAEERAAGLQKTIDRLREAEGSLSDKESRLQDAIQSETERHKKEEAVLSRRIEDLQQDLETRQRMLEDLRNELSTVRDELRQTQLDYQAQSDKIDGLEDEIEVLQATLDEETEKAGQDLDSARKESDELKKQLRELREIADSARSSTAVSEATAKHTSATVDQLQRQLADATSNFTKASRERQALQDQLSQVGAELHSLRALLAETKAERDELEVELQQAKEQDNDTFQLDQERLTLRATKSRLDNEVRRLKEENKHLSDQYHAMEKTLEDEIEKAAAEEDRLNQEIIDLQSKIKQTSGSQDLSSARRTIRDLERRIGDFEIQLATSNIPAGVNGEGNSELSLIRRDLSSFRQKELELLQREASHKDVVKGLKRQIADLERKAHEAEITRLVGSPTSEGGSARKTEVSELRQQLSSAHKSIYDLKKSLREAEKQSAASARELQDRIDDIEEQKLALEQALEDAQQAADEVGDEYKSQLKKYKEKLERYKRERDSMAAALAGNRRNHDTSNSVSSEMSREERHELHEMLRKTQIEADVLEREVREHKEALDELMQVEQSLRKKLDKARSERALYRADAEKLQRDVQALKASKDQADAAAGALVHVGRNAGPDDTGIDADAIIRAAEAAEHRHVKELRGMCMQIEWMQARWEREVQLRADAAYAKRYLLLELDVRDACNKADLVKLDGIMKQLGVKGRPASSMPAARQIAAKKQPITLKRVATAIRFVVRCQLSADAWRKHERTRQRLASAVEEAQKQKRIKKMRDEWRAQTRMVQ